MCSWFPLIQLIVDGLAWRFEISPGARVSYFPPSPPLPLAPLHTPPRTSEIPTPLRLAISTSATLPNRICLGIPAYPGMRGTRVPLPPIPLPDNRSQNVRRVRGPLLQRALQRAR